MSIGIPIKLIHEAEGHIITIELKSGEIYRGRLVEAEDNMNSQLQEVKMTARDGHVSELEHVYIRGSKIRFLILPDMLKNAPMFQRKAEKKGGTGGKTAILRAQAAARGRARGRGGPGGRGGGRGAPGGDRGGSNAFQRRQ
eukprot:Opistho-2@89128